MQHFCSELIPCFSKIKFAKDLGTTVSDLPKTLARNLAGTIKDSKLGKEIGVEINLRNAKIYDAMHNL